MFEGYRIFIGLLLIASEVLIGEKVIKAAEMGTEVRDFSLAKHIVSIQHEIPGSPNKFMAWCLGTIVNPRVILTEANCVNP